MKNESLNSEDFRVQFMQSGNSPISRLKNLSKILNRWNKSRIGIAGKGNEPELTIEDVKGLRQLINTEISRTKINNFEVVTDQILFLVIGAIKLQLQNNSDESWNLVNRSISSFLEPEKQLSFFSMMTLMFITTVVVFGITTTYLGHKAGIKTPLFSEDLTGTAAITEAGSNTVSNLVSIYTKMKEGECQLPQAAMLDPEEREVFISFVNDGKVDISTADRLKHALEHVNCLYPQKLMNKPL